MGIGRNSLDRGRKATWGRERRAKVESGQGGQAASGSGGDGGGSGPSDDTGSSGRTTAEIHRLFDTVPAPSGAGPYTEAARPGTPDPRGEPPSAEPAPFPQGSPAAAQPPAAPAWADHPITRALEAFYQPGPTNPVQIIADSVQPRGLREGQAFQEWFPLRTPPYTPPAEPAPAPAPIQETELAPDIAPAQEIDPHANFWQVWAGHQEFLLKQCIRLMSGNMADAEDALSNAMLRASNKFERYSDSIVNERAWLSRLVHNVCIDHYRRQRRTEYRDPHEDAGADIVSTMFADAQLTPEEIALEREQVRALDAEIAQLSDQLREPLMMRFVEGLSYPEIAERLNLRADTVRKRIQLARDHLKRADIR